VEKRFFKTFSAENSFFSQHFWGKIFREIFREIFRGIFPGKNVRKIGPWSQSSDSYNAIVAVGSSVFQSRIKYFFVFKTS
jgi:hypothetical protein